jgi:hypothetical protein
VRRGSELLATKSGWYLKRKREKKVKERKHPKHFVWMLIFCALLYFFDALFVGLPFLGILFCVVLMIANFWAFLRHRKTDPSSVARYGIRSLARCLTVLGILGTFMFNRHMGYVNARLIIKAVEDYRAAYGEYPERIEDLVPQFLSKVPRSAFRVTFTEYLYLHHNDHHSLMWVEAPPFGKPEYHFETKKWSYLD